MFLSQYNSQLLRDSNHPSLRDYSGSFEVLPNLTYIACFKRRQPTSSMTWGVISHLPSSLCYLVTRCSTNRGLFDFAASRLRRSFVAWRVPPLFCVKRLKQQLYLDFIVDVYPMFVELGPMRFTLLCLGGHSHRTATGSLLHPVRQSDSRGRLPRIFIGSVAPSDISYLRLFRYHCFLVCNLSKCSCQTHCFFQGCSVQPEDFTF